MPWSLIGRSSFQSDHWKMPRQQKLYRISSVFFQNLFLTSTAFLKKISKLSKQIMPAFYHVFHSSDHKRKDPVKVKCTSARHSPKPIDRFLQKKITNCWKLPTTPCPLLICFRRLLWKSPCHWQHFSFLYFFPWREHPKLHHI